MPGVAEQTLWPLCLFKPQVQVWRPLLSDLPFFPLSQAPRGFPRVVLKYIVLWLPKAINPLLEAGGLPVCLRCLCFSPLSQAAGGGHPPPQGPGGSDGAALFVLGTVSPSRVSAARAFGPGRFCAPSPPGILGSVRRSFICHNQGCSCPGGAAQGCRGQAPPACWPWCRGRGTRPGQPVGSFGFPRVWSLRKGSFSKRQRQTGQTRRCVHCAPLQASWPMQPHLLVHMHADTTQANICTLAQAHRPKG